MILEILFDLSWVALACVMALSLISAMMSWSAELRILYSRYIAGLACFAFSSLITLFVCDYNNAALVLLHSNQFQPLLYKITAVWGNHEGSLLMFVTMLSLVGLIASKRLDNAQIRAFHLVVGLIAFYSFFAANPFMHVAIAIEGLGLNPLLQDGAIAIHPPILYMGYSCVAVLYSLSFGEVSAAKIKQWSAVTLALLTAGIALGSHWAYRELGWGGYWFWDPVENVSLLPWLLVLAQFHSSIRGKISAWLVPLGLWNLILLLLGIFFVRSGLIESVHSFANDPTKSIILLLAILLLSYVAFKRLKAFSVAGVAIPWQIKSQHIILSVIAAIIVISLFYPIVMNLLFDEKVIITEKFFHLSIIPLGLMVLLLVSFSSKINILAVCIFLSLAVISAFIFDLAIMLMIAISISLFVILAMLMDLFKYRNIAYFLTHTGFAVMIAAITINVGSSDEINLQLEKKSGITAQDIKFELLDIELSKTQNYLQKRATLDINGDKFYPEVRIYYPAAKATQEAYIKRIGMSDYIAILGDGDETSGYALKLFIKPFVIFIWLGVLMMVIGIVVTCVCRCRIVPEYGSWDDMTPEEDYKMFVALMSPEWDSPEDHAAYDDL